MSDETVIGVDEPRRAAVQGTVQSCSWWWWWASTHERSQCTCDGCGGRFVLGRRHSCPPQHREGPPCVEGSQFSLAQNQWWSGAHTMLAGISENEVYKLNADVRHPRHTLSVLRVIQGRGVRYARHKVLLARRLMPYFCTTLLQWAARGQATSGSIRACGFLSFPKGERGGARASKLPLSACARVRVSAGESPASLRFRRVPTLR